MLKKLIIKNDPIVGDLELDFTLNNGQDIAKNIIFIGENGTCKTRLLKIISGNTSFIKNNNVSSYEFVFEKDDFEWRNERSQNDSFSSKIKNGENNLEIVIGNFYEKQKLFNGSDNLIIKGFYNNDAQLPPLPSSITVNQYNSNSENITKKKNKQYLEGQNIIYEINKLYECSSKQFTEENKSKETVNGPEEWKKTPFWKFQKAFNSFFIKDKSLKLDNCFVDTNKIIFKKEDIEIELNQLSDGEKLILVKLAKMLTKTNSFDDFRICLDEPDIKLHPEWQKNILNFLNENMPNNQFFVGTHSPFIVHSDCENKKIIELKWIDKKLSINYEPEYYIYINELEKISNEIWSFNDHQNSIYVEGKTDILYWKCFFKTYSINDWNVVSKENVGQLKNFYINLSKNLKEPKNNHFCIFDCDISEKEISKILKPNNISFVNENSKIKYHILAKTSDSPLKKGIENLLNLKSSSNAKDRKSVV